MANQMRAQPSMKASMTLAMSAAAAADTMMRAYWLATTS
jgi:hypothetical protein